MTKLEKLKAAYTAAWIAAEVAIDAAEDAWIAYIAYQEELEKQRDEA